MPAPRRLSLPASKTTLRAAVGPIRKSIRFLLVPGYYILGLAIVIALYLISPFRLIRIGFLYTARIGHLSYNLDNYLAARRQRSSDEIAIFATDHYVANQTLFSLWRRNSHLHFTQMVRPAWSVLNTWFPKSSLLISFATELHPTISVHSTAPANIRLDRDQLRRGNAFLESRGIKRPFVCFHNRDSAYLNQFGGDGNRHDFRDFAFEDFNDGIRTVLAMGYSAVRVGKIVKIDATITDPLFFSIVGTNSTDFTDIYLIAESSFFVGGTSGLSGVARIFRKPELLVNYIPFRLAELSAWSTGSIIVPKKLYSAQLGRLLRFSEMVSLPYDIHYKGDFFGDHGLTVQDNSPGEIADAVLEMERRLTRRWIDSEDQARLQSDFWRSMPDPTHVQVIRNALGIRVSSSFLERNAALI